MGRRGGPSSAQATTLGGQSPQLSLQRFTATKQQGLKIREEKENKRENIYIQTYV